MTEWTIYRDPTGLEQQTSTSGQRIEPAGGVVPWGINTFLRSSFPLQKLPPCGILLGMRKLTEYERQQVREDRKNNLLPAYGKCCLRCQYQWLPRVSEPSRCPRCRSSYWATERENRQGLRPGT